jgi:hypothetical protein
VGDLPPGPAIVDQARELGRLVLERASAEPLEFYEGPVVFEDRAAADFFRYLVPPEISGTPPRPAADQVYRQQTRHGPRLGRRLLPDGWSVVDDPTEAPQGTAGGYVYDREGVSGRRVELVHDGYVRDLLMSRVPRLEIGRSNGHARGSIGGEWVSRPAVWRVAPPRELSKGAFDAAVEQARENAALPSILVVRRLERGRDGRLPAPSWAVLRHADGREEPVASLEFQNVDRRTLRDVVAAAGEQVLNYLAPWEPEGHPGRDRGLATVLTAPRRILVEGMELVFPGPTEVPRLLPAPPTAAANEEPR